MHRFLALSATALSVASAQLSLSTQCTEAFTTVAFNSDAASCLNTLGLVPIFTDPSKSIIPGLETWLGGICSAPACSDATLTAVVTNLTTGCATELSALGLETTDAAETLVPYVLKYYPTVRKVACLQEGNSNCLTETLKDVEASLGTLSTENLATKGLSDLASIDPKILCTDCVKGAYNIIIDDIPEFNNDETKASVSGTCGADFVDGSTPEGVTLALSSKDGDNKGKDDGAAGKQSPGVYFAAAAFSALLAAV